jgi:hypothetical protein
MGQVPLLLGYALERAEIGTAWCTSGCAPLMGPRTKSWSSM